MIASKFHESYTYTLNQAYLHGGELYKLDDITTTESFVLQKLGWIL